MHVSARTSVVVRHGAEQEVACHLLLDCERAASALVYQVDCAEGATELCLSYRDTNAMARSCFT